MLQLFRSGELLGNVRFDNSTAPTGRDAGVEHRQLSTPVRIGATELGDSWESPAFLRSSKGSLNGLLDSPYDPFAEADGFVPGRGRKRPRFSFGNTDWRIIDDTDVPHHEETETNWADTLNEGEDYPEDVDSEVERRPEVVVETEENARAPASVSDEENATKKLQGESVSEGRLNGESEGDEFRETADGVSLVTEAAEAQKVTRNHLHLPVETPHLTPIPSHNLLTPSPLVTMSGVNNSYFESFMGSGQKRDNSYVSTEPEAHMTVVGEPQSGTLQQHEAENSTERPERTAIEAVVVKKEEEKEIKQAESMEPGSKEIQAVEVEHENWQDQFELEEGGEEELEESGEENEVKSAEEVEEQEQEQEQEQEPDHYQEQMRVEVQMQQLKREDWSHQDGVIQNDNQARDRGDRIVHSPEKPKNEVALIVDNSESGSSAEQNEESEEEEEEESEEQEDEEGPEYEDQESEQRFGLYGGERYEDGYVYDEEYGSEIGSDDESSATSEPKRQAPDVIVLDSDSEQEKPAQAQNLQQGHYHPPELLESDEEQSDAEESSSAEEEFVSVDRDSESETSLEGNGMEESQIQVEDEVENEAIEGEVSQAPSVVNEPEIRVEDIQVEEEGENEVIEGEVSQAPRVIEELGIQQSEVESYADNQSAVVSNAAGQAEVVLENGKMEIPPEHELPAPSAPEASGQSPKGRSASEEFASIVSSLFGPSPQHPEETRERTIQEEGPDDEINAVVIESSSPAAGVVQLDGASSQEPAKRPVDIPLGTSLHSPLMQEPVIAVDSQEYVAGEVDAVGRGSPGPLDREYSLGPELQLQAEMMADFQSEYHSVPTEWDTVRTSMSDEGSVSEEVETASSDISENHQHGPDRISALLSKSMPLAKLVFHLKSLVDTTSVVHDTSPIEELPAPGKTEYVLTVELTDPSLAGTIVLVQISYPHREALPLVSEGDVILLRKFLVKGLSRSLMLVNADDSEWVVLKTDVDTPPEVDEEKRSTASRLRKWYLEDGAARIADYKLQASIERLSSNAPPSRETSRANSAAPAELGHFETPLHALRRSSRSSSGSSAASSRRSMLRRTNMHQLRDGTRYADPDKESIHELRDGTIYVNR